MKYDIIIPFNLNQHYQGDIADCVESISKDIEVVKGVMSSNSLKDKIRQYEGKKVVVVTTITDRAVPGFISQNLSMPRFDQISLMRDQGDFSYDPEAMHEGSLLRDLCYLLLEPNDLEKCYGRSNIEEPVLSSSC